MKKSYVCTWCSKQVPEEHIDLHTAKHYVAQAELREKNPSTTHGSISSVSYVKED
jgi:hypothetical protein